MVVLQRLVLGLILIPFSCCIDAQINVLSEQDFDDSFKINTYKFLFADNLDFKNVSNNYIRATHQNDDTYNSCLVCNDISLMYFDNHGYNSRLKRKLENVNLNIYIESPNGIVADLNANNNWNTILPSTYVIDNQDLSRYLPQLPNMFNFCPQRGF